MSVTSGFAFFDFYSKLSKQMPFLIHIAAVLLLCYCKQDLMELLFMVLLYI